MSVHSKCLLPNRLQFFSFWRVSWEIAPFDNMGLDFDLGWFPPPVKKKGDKITYVWNAWDWEWDFFLCIKIHLILRR